MLAPSATAMQPLRTNEVASRAVSSFWVAQGRATSQATSHTDPTPEKVTVEPRRSA